MIAVTTQPTIAGQQAAEKFITDLSTLTPVGDDLYHIIDQHTTKFSPEHDAFLRGFCRRIQKFCEARA